MKFLKLAKYLKDLEDTASRIEITKILSNLFKEAEIKEIDKVVYLLLGRLAPRYESVVFNIADKMMVRVLSEAYGKDVKEVTELYKKEGDLGVVAENLAKTKTSGLSVTQVFEKLKKIATDEGEGSQERKVKKTADLLSNLDPTSARYVARIPVGKLRLGFSDKTIIDAISWMLKGDKSLSSQINNAYHYTPDVGQLVKKVKEKGIDKTLKNISPSVGTPVLPMLAQRLKSSKEMIDKMGEVAVEPKLDGLRILLHYKKGKDGFVKAFTRNLNETSWMFPELKRMGENVKATELILDTEAVGLDSDAKKIANFQTTMTRRRKHGVEEKANKVPIKFFCFDILYKDGKNLMTESYLKRRSVLESVIENNGLFEIVKSTRTEDPSKIVELNEKYKKEGLEGVLVKKVDSSYVPGRTGWRWVKMKEREGAHASLADTVDAVIMGYSRGRGRRASFGVGQFLAGVVEGDKIKTITKVGTGLTDDQFKELNKRLEKIRVDKKPVAYEVNKILEPDFWVEPKQVVEIAADELTKSPSHTSGYALRFPRLVKFRDDKSVDESTSLREIKNISSLV